MLDISKNKNSLYIKAAKYQLDLNLDKGIAFLKTGEGKELFEFPLDVQIQQQGESIQVGNPLQSEIKDQKVSFLKFARNVFGGCRSLYTMAAGNPETAMARLSGNRMMANSAGCKHKRT